MTNPADISDVMRQQGSDQVQDAWRLKKYPSLYGDERVTPAGQDGEGYASQATRKPKGNGMIFELTWHGPVGDVYYRVEADTEEDAMQEPGAERERREVAAESRGGGERMNIDSSQGLEVSDIIFRNSLEPEKGATSMMDSINLESPEFMITVHRSG